MERKTNNWVSDKIGSGLMLRRNKGLERRER